MTSHFSLGAAACAVALFITSAATVASPGIATPEGGGQDGAATIGQRLMQDAAVKAALDRVKREEPQVIDEQVRLCEIPAPPFKETARAEAYKQAFVALGLKNVRIDKVGNVLGERPGLAARPHLVFSAHLDTVFPEGTDVKTSRSGSVIKGPGIGDDCRGLAVILAVVRMMNAANIQTPGSITFVGTVGEEGLGDLRGVKHLFNEELKGRIDRFVSVDGTGLGITHVAVGSLRYRVTFKGPGGHSYGAFGIANPIHALGRAMAKIGDLQVPARAEDHLQRRARGRRHVRELDCVRRVDGSGHAVGRPGRADRGRRELSQGGRHGAGGRKRAMVQQRTADGRQAARGQSSSRARRHRTRRSSRQRCRSPAPSEWTRALDEGSTDSNIAISLGIPAVTIDGGGTGRGTHSLDESFDTTNSWQGTARALLLAVALAR